MSHVYPRRLSLVDLRISASSVEGSGAMFVGERWSLEMEVR